MSVLPRPPDPLFGWPPLAFIIPVYNKAPFLRACIASILDQGLEQIQVICIDDASTDGSYDILSEFMSDRRFQIVRFSRNLGPGVARNRGLELASAEYVRFVDADDLLPKNSSLRLLSAADESGVDIVRGNIELFNSKGPEGVLLPVGSWGRVKFHKWQALRIPWYFTACIFRREAILASRALFPELRMGEDAVFLATMLCNCGTVRTISDLVYCVRSRERTLNYSRSDIRDYIKHAKLTRTIFVRNNYRACWETYKAAILAGELARVACLAVASCNSAEKRAVEYDAICHELEAILSY